jgi:small-conductance mechanosensitive channel
MQERRVDLKLGVTYKATRENLVKGPQLMEEIIRSEKQVRFDRAHFASMGDFSLNFEAVYWVLSPDYNLHMDIKARILLKIHEAFEAHSLDFAFPTQTIILDQAGLGESKNLVSREV